MPSAQPGAARSAALEYEARSRGFPAGSQRTALPGRWWVNVQRRHLDAAGHIQMVFDPLGARSAKVLIKDRSMVIDECAMHPFLEARGIALIEAGALSRTHSEGRHLFVAVSVCVAWPR